MDAIDTKLKQGGKFEYQQPGGKGQGRHNRSAVNFRDLKVVGTLQEESNMKSRCNRKIMRKAHRQGRRKSEIDINNKRLGLEAVENLETQARK